MKEVTITSVWRAEVTLEVDDDADIRNDNFSDWPEEVLENVTSQVAELIDWDVK